MNLFIYKPKGALISQATRKSLAKKYKSGCMIYASNNDRWSLPEKVLTMTRLEEMDAPFSEDVESVIYFTDVYAGPKKRLWYFDENKETGAWSIYFASEVKSIDGTYASSLKYPFDYNEDTSATMFYNAFLKAVSNLSKIKLLKFILGEDKSESVIITNGNVHLFTENSYDVDGAIFSNLEHENDLSPDEVKILALSLSLYKFLQDSTQNAKEISTSLAKMPHRELKQMAKDARLEKFYEDFSLTI